MTPREQGFLLLTSQLGDPERRPLTTAQLRNLTARMRTMERPKENREMTAADLRAIGYGREMAERILNLLADGELLALYVRRGRKAGCVPITRVTPDYPGILRQRLGADSPGCLWAKGDVSVLKSAGIALVGSRDLNPENRAFAREVGRQAALQGFTLISGNARGADQAAQEACLAAGGKVVSVVADALEQHPVRDGVLYLAEESYDEPFSSQRALSRNRVIHCLGRKTCVAQCSLETGGTWDGTTKNLHFGWSPVFCYDDGSPAMKILEQLGAVLIGPEMLKDFAALRETAPNFFDQ